MSRGDGARPPSRCGPRGPRRSWAAVVRPGPLRGTQTPAAVHPGAARLRAVRRLDRVAHSRSGERPSPPSRTPTGPPRAARCCIGFAVLLCVNQAVLRSRRRDTDRQFDGAGAGAVAADGRPRAVGRAVRRARRAGACSAQFGWRRSSPMRGGQRFAGRTRRRSAVRAAVRGDRGAARPAGHRPGFAAPPAARAVLLPVRSRGVPRPAAASVAALAGPDRRREQHHRAALGPDRPPRRLARAVPAGLALRWRSAPSWRAAAAAGPSGGPWPRRWRWRVRPERSSPAASRRRRPRPGSAATRHPGEGPDLRAARRLDVLRVPRVDRRGRPPGPASWTTSSPWPAVPPPGSPCSYGSGSTPPTASPPTRRSTRPPRRTRSPSARGGAAPASPSSPPPSPPCWSRATRRRRTGCATAGWSPSCGWPWAGCPTRCRRSRDVRLDDSVTGSAIVLVADRPDAA